MQAARAKRIAAKSAPKPMTVTRATTEARAKVDKLMPGVGATVESRLSHDLVTDTPTVITTVTFPAYHHNAMGLALSAHLLSGYRSHVLADSSLVITRSR